MGNESVVVKIIHQICDLREANLAIGDPVCTEETCADFPRAIRSPAGTLRSTVSVPSFLFVGHGVGQPELYAEKSRSAPDGELQQRQREDRHCIGADPTGKQAIRITVLM